MAMVQFKASIKVKCVWLCAMLFWLRLEALAKKLIVVDIVSEPIGQ